MRDSVRTNVVSGLFILISLLVHGSLGLVWSLIGVRKLLPLLAEDASYFAKGDTRIVFTYLIAIAIGEKHVRGESTLGSILVLCETVVRGMGLEEEPSGQKHTGSLAAAVPLLRLVDLSLGHFEMFFCNGEPISIKGIEKLEP